MLRNNGWMAWQFFSQWNPILWSKVNGRHDCTLMGFSVRRRAEKEVLFWSRLKLTPQLIKAPIYASLCHLWIYFTLGYFKLKSGLFCRNWIIKSGRSVVKKHLVVIGSNRGWAGGVWCGVGWIAQWIAFSLPTQRPWVQFLLFPTIFLLVSLRFIDGTS